MKRISSPSPLGAVLAACPTESADYGSMIDDYVAQIAASDTGEWIEGILFVLLVKKKHTMCLVIG